MTRFLLCFLLFSLSSLPSRDRKGAVLKSNGEQPTAGMSELILGFVFDSSVGLQPILGIPGAALIGPPLKLEIEPDRVWISPLQDYALARSAQDLWIAPLRSTGEQLSMRLLDHANPMADLITFSPSGSSAVLYDSTSGRVQVITGLPDAPSVARETGLPDGAASSLTALAISDDGSELLAGFSSDTGSSISLLQAEGGTRFVTAVRHPSVIAFLRHSGEAVVADDADNKVWLIRDVAGAAQAVLLASEQDGIKGPSAAAVSSDNRRAFIANAESRTVAALDFAGRSPTLYVCPCVPGALHRLSGDSVFRLTEPEGGPLWLFDGDAPEPRIVFVPPYRTIAAKPE